MSSQRVSKIVKGQVIEAIKNKLDTLHSSDNSLPMFYRKVAAVYESCVQGSDPENGALLSLIQTLDGWPLINYGWNVSCHVPPCALETFDVGAQVGLLQSHHDISTLFYSTVEPDWKMPYKNVIHLKQGNLFLGYPGFYKSQDKIQSYTKNVVQIANALAQEANMTLNSQNTVAATSTMVQFEKNVSKIMLLPWFNRSPVQRYNPMTKGDMKRRWPNINWEFYFLHILPFNQLVQVHNLTVHMPAQHTNQTFATAFTWPDNNTVIIEQPSYFDSLNALLNVTASDTLQNYFIWRLLGARLFMVNSTAAMSQSIQELTNRNLNDNPDVSFGDRKSFPLTNLECARRIKTIFPSQVSQRLYLDQTGFTPQTLNIVMAMAINVAHSMAKMIKSVPWITQNSTKMDAMSKFMDMDVTIGYTNWITNDTRMNMLMEPLNLTSLQLGNPVTVYESVTQFKQMTYFNRLLQPVDTTSFQTNIGPADAISTAKYDPSLNSLFLPVGLLQPPYFRVDYPKAYNYGSLGSIIGHHMAHAFDAVGICFGMFNKLTMLLDPASMLGFANMTQCLQQEYGQMCPAVQNGSPLCISGNATVDENMADAMGLTAAYMAYQSFISTNGQESSLPGLSYNMNQIFFLSSMQPLCSYNSHQSLINLLTVYPHTPNNYRVYGSVMNTPQFGLSFGCTQGQDTMYPVDSKACHVWRK